MLSLIFLIMAFATIPYQTKLELSNGTIKFSSCEHGFRSNGYNLLDTLIAGNITKFCDTIKFGRICICLLTKYYIV